MSSEGSDVNTGSVPLRRPDEHEDLQRGYGGQGRPSAVAPQVLLERRVSPGFALFFYGFLLAASWVWLANTGRSVRALWTPRHAALEIGIGLAAGLALVAAAPFLVRRIRALKELEREFGWILGEQRTWECLFLAVLSAVAEEMFFRGAVQAALGPILALVLFAGLHWPINGQFRAWPLTALLAGAILAAERHWTQTLIAPVITHAVVNAVNLIRITRTYRVWKE